MSSDLFSDTVTSDFNWRVRELSDYKATISIVDARYRAALLRGGVPLVYAHWEGHVSFAAKSYLKYLTLRRLAYGSLKRPFVLKAMSSDFDRLASKGISIGDKIAFVLRLDACSSERFSDTAGRMANTKSNLTSENLRDICIALAIDPTPFEAEYSYIDRVIVGRRNYIAHGESVAVNLTDFEDLVQRTIGLMRLFRNAVDNAVQLEAFKVAVPVP